MLHNIADSCIFSFQNNRKRIINSCITNTYTPPIYNTDSAQFLVKAKNTT